MPEESWSDAIAPDSGKTDGESLAGTRSGSALNTVVLSIPADRDQVVLVRSVAAHIGVRLGLSVAELSDLRLAVDEACGAFLLSPEFGGRGETLDCRFEELSGTLTVAVSAPVGATLGPDEGDIGWIMLGALVDELSWHTEDGIGTVRLVKRLATGRGV
jgi:serine/threonine-protein kinase RsbW